MRYTYKSRLPGGRPRAPRRPTLPAVTDTAPEELADVLDRVLNLAQQEGDELVVALPGEAVSQGKLLDHEALLALVSQHLESLGWDFAGGADEGVYVFQRIARPSVWAVVLIIALIVGVVALVVSLFD